MKDYNRSSSNYTPVWTVVAFFAGVVCIVILTYIDFEIISPLILPEDPCYYHTHKAPYWVQLLYMSPANNGHPNGNTTHFILLILLGFTLGHFTTRKIRRSLR